MSAAGGVCSKCGDLIDVRNDYREVTGYERVATGSRGRFHLIDRTGQTFVCRWCVEKLEKGLAIGQGTLI